MNYTKTQLKEIAKLLKELYTEKPFTSNITTKIVSATEIEVKYDSDIYAPLLSEYTLIFDFSSDTYIQFEHIFDNSHKKFTNKCSKVIYENCKLVGNYDLYNYLQSIESDKYLEDFVNKINASNKFKILCDYSLDEFFSENCNSDLEIITANINKKIITINKHNNEYRYIVYLSNDNGELFSVNMIIKSKTKLDRLLADTIESLRTCNDLKNYADYLEEIV